MNTYINIPEYNVSQFNKLFKDVIESNFDYVRIKGEISEIKTATRGQIYLTLKDNQSILSGVIWDSKKKFLIVKYPSLFISTEFMTSETKLASKFTSSSNTKIALSTWVRVSDIAFTFPTSLVLKVMLSLVFDGDIPSLSVPSIFEGSKDG